MSKLLEQINKAEKSNLGSVSHYVTDKIDVSELSLDNYISTENMLSERGGITQATKLPNSGKVTKFEPGDTLTSNIRPYFKKIWQATKNGGCSNDVLAVRTNNRNELDENFLYYNISNDVFFAYSMMSSQGTKMPRGDKDAIMKYEISFPDLPTQKKIAEILSAYDEKIENNNLIINKLKATAQTLFNEWFVNFRFPGYEKAKFVDSEMGEIPEGWEVGKISDLGNVVCGKTPSKSHAEYFGGNIPFIKIPDMHGQVFINTTEDSLTEAGVSTQKNKTVPAGSVCVSCIATVGLVSITIQDSQTNQQINTLIPNNEEFLEYSYFTLANMKSDLQAIGSGGSTTLNVNTSVFSEFEILIPDTEIVKAFHEVISKMFDEIKHLTAENIFLKSQRDQLLAKLI